MNHKLVKFDVTHTRFTPKRYEFSHHFFWFKIDLDAIESWPSAGVSFNKFNFYQFKDSDHIKLGPKTARENYIKFAKDSGLETEVENVVIYTQLRFLGYVFNPVSFIVLTDSENKQHAIIEIGNTFNEQKPFFVHHNHFLDNGFIFKTKKYFYISPFIDHDNEMVFKFRQNEEKLYISIDDQKGDEKILKVLFQGEEIPATTWNLIIQTLCVPFVTLKIIFLIHFHAMILWMKGIPYFKKDEHKELQQGAIEWKTSKQG